MDWLSVLRILVAFLALLLASWSDWNTRTASDSHWLMLGTIGFVLLGVEIFMDGVSPLYYLFLIPLGIIFYDIFWDRPGIFEDGMYDLAVGAYAIAMIVLVALALLLWTEAYFWRLMTIPILIIIFTILYYLDLIKGGADAKALIALAVLFPTYPVIDGFPLIRIPMESLQYLFPFAFLVLFNAALFMIIFPVIFFLINLARGDRRLPAMFFGYRMDLEKAERSFVWILDRVENGGVEVRLFPSEADQQREKADLLRERGVDRVWVTPKIPFLIPLAVSVLFSALVGNPFFLLIG